MASSASFATSLALIFCLVGIALPTTTLATTYTVGDTSGWAIGADYTTWTAGKSFKVGDSLVFNYPGGHTVDEVSASDYKTCTVGNALNSDNSGATTVPLKTAGTHYFICGVVGHCGGGMKLAVTVAAAAAGGSATPTTSPASGGGADTTTTSPATPAATASTTPNRQASNFPDSSAAAGNVAPLFGAVIVAAAVALVMVSSS
ncbi:unnamed protein product [Linum tenue]|uniref:Phytocyanin domain-containing protein n=1 Tax=Linum tenue TaxID=586396 RepID=A0AAV0MP88_9ROSI|nr:unnamed protein product [Linum tenue]